MLYWVLLFVLGEVLTDKLPLAVMVSLNVLYLAVVCITKSSFINKNRKLLVCGGLFIALGLICVSYNNMSISVVNEFADKNISFCGDVTDAYDIDKGKYGVKVSNLNGHNFHTRFVVVSDVELCPGMRLKARGKVSDFSEATNPGEYNSKSYEYGRGNTAQIKDISIDEAYYPLFRIRTWLYNIRRNIGRSFDMWLDEDDASLAKAMVLGEKSGISEDVRALYQRSGIAHLIAISGLHIALLGGTLYKLIRRCVGSFFVAAVPGMTFIVLYGVMTGLSGATIRAIIMLCVAIGADVLGRKYDSLSAIALALFLMLLSNPYQVYQVGFLLSFGAVLGIAYISPIFEKYNADAFLKGLFVSISVQIATTPILLYFFYEIPLYAVILNIIVVPLMSVLLADLIMISIFYHVTMLSWLFSKVATYIFLIYENLCLFSDKLPSHCICTGRPDFLWVICYYVVLLLTLFFYKRKRKKEMFATGLLMILLFVTFLIPANLKITMFDVGQGDGIYIQTPKKQRILIDGGSSSKKQVGKYILKNGLKYNGASHLSYLIITHSDSDHYSGALELMEDKTIKIDTLILPAITNPDDSYRMLEKTAKDCGSDIYYAKRGDCIIMGDVSFYCLNPEKTMYSDKNQSSIVMWLRYKKFDIMLTGDADAEVERHIINNKVLQDSINSGNRIEVLKVGHHGSNTATSDGLLKACGFSESLISVGARNRYGHPSARVLDSLKSYGVNMYLTKQSGAITIRTDGNKYTIEEFVHNEENQSGH